MGKAVGVVSTVPKLKVTVRDDLMEKVAAVAETLWPGHGVRGVTRLIRDAIRRYLKYCDD